MAASIEDFLRWLDEAERQANFALENPDSDMSSADLDLHLQGCEIALVRLSVAKQLVVSFKLGQSNG
ncbi:hypothetical protein [Comamonas thiooxydans]|uniref:hypothetical protein n=1 Tax=Comamonas thiooxydans TaxID=363952 RepID=UPI0005A2D2C8|nr:hypothetical protein [Comamonas thiooxydans]MDO1475231.1 hypothetical protein [Comamonas thiooxydans]